MDEFLARLRDEKTQLTIASVVAGLILVAAIIALPRSDDPASERAVPSASGADAAIRPGSTPGIDQDAPASGGPGSGTVSVPTDAGGGIPPGQVISKTEIKVGITYLEDPGQANAAAGFDIAQIDQRRSWEAMVRDVNRDPPFGRKIVPVWYSQTENDLTSKGEERIAQEACARFTQDNKVFMVWVGTIGAGSDTLSACLTKAKVPQIAFGTGSSYSRTFKSFPYLIEPTSAAMDRMAAFYVDELFDAKFFSGFKNNQPPYTPSKPADGKAKIGLIRYDEASHRAGAVALKKRLATHGLSLCSGCEFDITYSTDDVVEQLNDAGEINSAIQNCKSRGCTHMLFLGSAAQRIPTFFIDGAESQAYRPRLGFSPLDSWEFVRDFVGARSETQFRQSQIVTWSPTDFGGSTTTFSRCKKLFADAGESFSEDEATDKESMIPAYCDTAAYYEAAMAGTGATLNLDSWLRGVHTMKPIPSAGTYRMQTKAGRHDGIGAVQVGSWSDPCHCFKPATGVIAV